MKRILCFFLSVIMLLTITVGLDLSAVAKETSFSVEAELNPLYEDIVDKSAIISELDSIGDKAYIQSGNHFSFSEKASSNKAIICQSITQASMQLKDGMVNREGQIDVSICSTMTDTNELVRQIFHGSYNQSNATGTCDGDYLRWHWSSYKVSGSYTPQSDGTIIYNLRYTVTYYTTKAEEDAVTEKIEEIIAQLNLRERGIVPRIRVIHDYICDLIQYDYINAPNTDYKYQFTTYASLFNGRAVCQGYATLFYRLCMELGMDCRIVTGSNHAWNIVKIGNLYYNIDCTWDDSSYDYKISDDDYWSGGHVIYNYYLKGSDDFVNHTRVEEFDTTEFHTRYPMATTAFVCSHSNAVWMMPASADCSVGFTKIYLCPDCEVTLDSVEIAANTAHQYVSNVVPATCLEKGYTQFSCMNCAFSFKANYINALGHQYIIEDETPATCTESGSVYYVCTRCDYSCSALTDDPLGHMHRCYGIIANGNYIYSCDYCGHTETVTPDSLLVMWNVHYVNKTPNRTAVDNSCYLDVVPDGIINAKDFSKLTKSANLNNE